jgi:hypothetical protein
MIESETNFETKRAGHPPVGLVPDSDKDAAKALAKETASAATGNVPAPESVPGHVEAVAKNRSVTDRAVIYVTQKQASAMQAAINSMIHNPQAYDPAYRNCASFVEQVLGAGGIRAPADITPGGLVSDLKKQFPQ